MYYYSGCQKIIKALFKFVTVGKIVLPIYTKDNNVSDNVSDSIKYMTNELLLDYIFYRALVRQTRPSQIQAIYPDA